MVSCTNWSRWQRPRPGATTSSSCPTTARPRAPPSRTGTATTWQVLVARLSQSDVAASDESVEGWGRTQALVDELASTSGATGRGMQSASDAMDKRDRNEPDAVAPAAAPSAAGVAKTKGTPLKGKSKKRKSTKGDETFHVFGSGNLGLIYVRGEKERLDRRTLQSRYPGLVDGLAAHPGVGFVVVMDDDGPVALGNDGLAPAGRRTCRGRRPASGVRVLRSRVRAPGRTPPGVPRHLRQQPGGARHRGGRGVRGPRRLPRRTRWLAGPGVAWWSRPTCPSLRSAWSAPTRCTSRFATYCATSVTGRGSPSPARRADPAGRRDRRQPVSAATRPSSTARRSAA